MIKLAINRWAFKSDWSADVCIRMAKKHGFDGIEFNLEEEGDFSLETSEPELQRIKALAERAGLELSSVCSLLFWKYPITSSDASVRDKGIEVIRKMIDAASALEVHTILVVPGMVHADPPLDFGNPPIPYATAYERALSIIRDLADYAEPKAVTIGLENVFYNKFLITQMEYKRFIEDVGRANVKLYFDVGNTMLCGFPEDWIRYLSDYICCIHVKDFDKNVNTLYGWRNIFQGDIDWEQVTGALRTVGYAGYLVGEPSLSPYKFQQEELIKTTSSALQRVREMIANRDAS
jgi:L-ribulose-5-phosphate 3-epimerase